MGVILTTYKSWDDPSSLSPYKIRWWIQIFVLFTPICGEMIQFDYIIFFKWVVQPPPIQVLSSKKGPRSEKSHKISPWNDEGPKLQSNEEGDLAGRKRHGCLLCVCMDLTPICRGKLMVEILGSPEPKRSKSVIILVEGRSSLQKENNE